MLLSIFPPLGLFAFLVILEILIVLYLNIAYIKNKCET
jgi:hypothetical protein